MEGSCIQFSDLPGQAPLFLDFVRNFEKVRHFYQPIPFSERDIQARVDSILERSGMARQPVAACVTRYNRALGQSTRLDQHLRALGEEDSVAVVTGQQVGLFGGPAFTVYKAATAIRMASRLREMGVNAVPVFWLASNDSDFEEIRESHFLDASSDLVSVRFSQEPDDHCRMAGTVDLSSIENCLKQLEETTGFHPFHREVLESLSRAYRPELTFRDGFARWISRLFSEHGLIVFDPLMEGLSEHVSRFFEIAVTRRQSLVESLLSRNEEIRAAGYSPQVHVDEAESLLFLVEGAFRYKLTWTGDHYRAKETGASFTTAEMREMALTHPEKLGVNVLLRPILQDYLLPTAYYIGGPSEIAYFAQLNSIAGHWDVQPLIAPRAGFTMVCDKEQRYLERHQISTLDVLQKTPEQLAEIILRETEWGQVLERVESVEDSLRGQLSDLQSVIHEADPTVAEMLENTRGKMMYQLEKVKTRFIANHKQIAPSLEGHLHHLLNHLRPAGKLQERVLNFNHFLMDRGPGLLDELIDFVDPFCFSHRIVQL